MKQVTILGLIAVTALLAPTAVLAAEAGSGGNWLSVGNRLRFEYDDNVYETKADKEDSFKLIEELELGVTLNFEPTFLTLRYRPSFTWWENREPDDTDLHHDFDVVLNHRVSPRLSMGLKNTFRYAESPEEIDRGTVVRENGDYIYNVTDGNLDYQILPRTYMLVGGRYTTLQYDEASVAATEDYDIWSAGLTLRQNITDLSRIMADYRRESIDYDGDDRGSDSDYIGLGLEHVLGASFVGVLRGGYQMKDFNDEGIEDADEPYFDATLTYIYSPRTRFSAGGGFSMFESDIYPFANQDRTIMFASVAHELTAKISLYIAGSYQLSEYDADQRIINDLDLPADFSGDEDIMQGSARVAYQVNARNSLEINYQYIDLQSDLREDFDRNRVSIGWRLDI
jgi:hypothetical protein